MEKGYTERGRANLCLILPNGVSRTLHMNIAHSDKYFLKHTGPINLVNELFFFCLVNRQA